MVGKAGREVISAHVVPIQHGGVHLWEPAEQPGQMQQTHLFVLILSPEHAFCDCVSWLRLPKKVL